MPRLDVLRGLAILGVLAHHWIGATSGFYHLGWTGDRPRWEAIPSAAFALVYPLNLGSSGVAVLFVLSGYLIHGSGLRRFDPRSYWLRRSFRIYPGYLVALALFVALRWSRGERVPLWDCLTHALLVHDFSNQAFWTINSSFWSLAVEWQFYLVYPLILLLRRRIGMTGCLVVASLLLVASLSTCYALVPPDRDRYPVPWNSPLNSWAGWVAGAWLAERHAASSGPAIRPARALALVSIAVVIGAEVWRPLAVVTMGAVGIALVLIDRYGRRAGPLSQSERHLAALGGVSYSIYLLHQPAYKVVADRLGSDGWADAWWYPLSLVPAILGAAALGRMFHSLVEVPGVRLGRLVEERRLVVRVPAVVLLPIRCVRRTIRIASAIAGAAPAGSRGVDLAAAR